MIGRRRNPTNRNAGAIAVGVGRTQCARPRRAADSWNQLDPRARRGRFDRRRAVSRPANINRPLPPQTPRAPRAPRARQTPPFGASPSRAARGRLCPRVSSRARLDATREGRGPEARVERASSVGRGPRFSARMSALDEVAAGAWAGLVGTVLGYPLDVVKGRMQTGKTGLPSLPAGAGSRPRPPSFGARRRVGTGVRLASRGARPFPRVRTLFLLPLALDARRRPPSHPAPSPPPKHYSPPEKAVRSRTSSARRASSAPTAASARPCA